MPKQQIDNDTLVGIRLLLSQDRALKPETADALQTVIETAYHLFLEHQNNEIRRVFSQEARSL